MAAAKVFAIPELVEHILIKLNDMGPSQPTFNGARNLFLLQRVNNTFHTAIQSSPELRRQMLLEYVYPPGTYTGAPDEDCFVVFDYLERFGHLSTSPLQLEDSSFGSDNNILFHYLVEHKDINKPMHFGILAGGSKKVHSGKRDSWRKIKMFTYVIPAVVEFRIEEFRQVDEGHWMAKPIQARSMTLNVSRLEEVSSNEARDTLGDFVDELEAMVRERSTRAVKVLEQ